MKEIRRNYLNRLVEAIGTEDIKVITGVRRCGKSYLLREFKEYVQAAFSDANIIEVDYSTLYAETLKEYHALHAYVENAYKKGKRNFVLIDEVQSCKGFELAINSLHALRKYDIYVTGSNAFIDSSSLATLFAGRTYTIEMFPFSLKEYMDYHDYINQYDAFKKYLIEGGFAGSYGYGSLAAKQRYVNEIFDTIIVRDIELKYDLRHSSVLESITEFMADNIARLTSIRKITNALNSNHVEISDKTVGNYVQYLCEAFAFYRMRRYDLKGKRYLASHDKYYLVDHSLRTARLGTASPDYGSVYENIVAIELMRRGYEVHVGTLRDAEIDFFARRQDDQFYIQVSEDIGNTKTLEREIRPFEKIKDVGPKLLLASTNQPRYTRDGVQIIDIADWLVEDSLI